MLRAGKATPCHHHPSAEAVRVLDGALIYLLMRMHITVNVLITYWCSHKIITNPEEWEIQCKVMGGQRNYQKVVSSQQKAGRTKMSGCEKLTNHFTLQYLQTTCPKLSPYCSRQVSNLTYSPLLRVIPLLSLSPSSPASIHVPVSRIKKVFLIKDLQWSCSVVNSSYWVTPRWA